MLKSTDTQERVVVYFGESNTNSQAPVISDISNQQSSQFRLQELRSLARGGVKLTKEERAELNKLEEDEQNSSAQIV